MKKILIIQNKPTQFDVPLYNKIHRESDLFNLSVIYTETYDKNSSYDSEINRSTAWDHILSEEYCRHDLDPKTSNDEASVIRLVESLEPDYVLISGYYPPLHRKLVKPLKARGYRIGLRSDNTLPHSNFKGLKGIAKRILLPVWLRRYEFWHPVGSLAKEYLLDVSGVSRPVFMFPYNVDNDWFLQRSMAYKERKNIRLQEMGFPDDAFVVLGIMKWHAREDPLTLIHAFRLLTDRKNQARLILVGDGPLRDEVKQQLVGVEDKVYLPGYVNYSRLPEYYALANVFVHPSPDEPWGVSVNEAMACGVPVIAAKGVGAAVDLVEEGVTGYIFENRDTAQLSDRLLQLLEQDDKESMRAACLKKMQAWHYDQTIQAFSQIIEE